MPKWLTATIRPLEGAVTPTPAQHTRPSRTPPQASMAAFTAACRPLALERSATMSAWARSMPMTRWPAACSWRQTAAPIPEAEPVTTVVGMKCLLEMKGAPVRVILQYVEALAARASSARTRRLRGARPYNSRLQMVPPLTPGSPSR